MSTGATAKSQVSSISSAGKLEQVIVGTLVTGATAKRPRRSGLLKDAFGTSFGICTFG